MESPEKPTKSRIPAVLIIIAIVGLLIGGLVGYGISSLVTAGQINNLKSNVSNLQNQIATDNSTINSLSSKVATLQNQVTNLESTQNSSAVNETNENVTYENNTYVLGENVSLPQLYNQVKTSIVMVQGIVQELEGYDFFGNPIYEEVEVEGSGFVSNLTGQFAIITNYHVIQNAVNVTVTFTDGDTYLANVTGTDLYSDLATLSTEAPQSEYQPLAITSSSTLEIGDPVFAVGNPLGLTGTMTSGIVSALHRSVTVDWTSYAIADCIQTSTPINPGNSGGPLLNYAGDVVGITSYTATYNGAAAQGLGLAIPSSTILRETPSLIVNGSYNSHPYLGANGYDMDYEIAQLINTTVTYGWLIAQVTSGGPAATAGLLGGTTQVDILGNTETIGGEIIIAINGTRITNGDALTSYMEEYTLSGQTVNVTIVRDNQTMSVSVTLGTRPPPSTS